MFASPIKKNKSSIDCSSSFKLNRVRFYNLFSLKEVITFGNNFYEAQVSDVVVLHKKIHLEHFAFGDTTGPVQVYRVQCCCGPAFPSSYLNVPIAENDFGFFIVFHLIQLHDQINYCVFKNTPAQNNKLVF